MNQSSSALTPRREALLLATLALVQFTAVVDFLVMAPLGPKLINLWGISTRQFGLAVSAYVFTAGIFGFLGAFVIDKFDRKRVLTFVYAGFTVGTIACGFAPNYTSLVAARILTGVFGGLIGTLVFSVISDALPLERRGRSFGIVTASFSLASILGVPGGLYFANLFDWHAPFLILGGLSVLVQVFVALFIPNITGHLSAPRRNPVQILGTIARNKNQMWALALVICISVGQFSVLPFLTPYLVTNVGVSEAQLPFMYLVGGLATVVASPLIGILTDKKSKASIYTIAAVISIAPIVALTNYGFGLPIVLIFATSALMFVCINGRMIPGMALVQGTVLPFERGSFTSISTSVQQLASGIATFGAGFLVVKGTDGILHGYNVVGLMAVAFTILSLFIVRRVKQVQMPASGEQGKMLPSDKPDSSGAYTDDAGKDNVPDLKKSLPDSDVMISPPRNNVAAGMIHTMPDRFEIPRAAPPTDHLSVAHVRDASKVYKTGDTEIVALQPTTMEVRKGELLLIIGPSGSGKTTLLSLLGCVIYPSTGTVNINGTDTTNLTAKQMADLRLNNIGFLFQSFNLVAPLSAEENVMIPLRLRGVSEKEARERAHEVMERVGMIERRKQLPRQLSGGQQQRIAIARALVGEPTLMLCDEPTAALDVKSVNIVMEELREIADSGRALAVVTHDMRLKPYAHRIIEVENGIAREVSHDEAAKHH